MLLFINIGTGEIVLIILVYFLLFGTKGLPEIMRKIGRLTRKARELIWKIEDTIDNIR